MTNEFLYDNKIIDGTPPSLHSSPILQNIFRKVDSNKSSYLSNEDDIIKRINNNMQPDIFNNFASFNSTDSSTHLINESESKYFRNDNINNFDMINTGKFDKFENGVLGENNTLDSITEKTQKQSDECKNKIYDEINLKGNNRMYDNNYNNNINVQNSMNDNNAQMKNNYYSMLEDKIKYDNKDQNII